MNPNLYKKSFKNLLLFYNLLTALYYVQVSLLECSVQDLVYSFATLKSNKPC